MPNVTMQANSLMEVIDYTMKIREQIAKLFIFNLQKRVGKEFQVEDLVYC